jgi:hypothetical protein
VRFGEHSKCSARKGEELVVRLGESCARKEQNAERFLRGCHPRRKRCERVVRLPFLDMFLEISSMYMPLFLQDVLKSKVLATQQQEVVCRIIFSSGFSLSERRSSKNSGRENLRLERSSANLDRSFGADVL